MELRMKDCLPLNAETVRPQDAAVFVRGENPPFPCDLFGVRQGGGMRAALDRACVLRPDGDIGHAAKPAVWRARGT